jgi:hypothetical protein
LILAIHDRVLSPGGVLADNRSTRNLLEERGRQIQLAEVGGQDLELGASAAFRNSAITNIVPYWSIPEESSASRGMHDDQQESVPSRVVTTMGRWSPGLDPAAQRGFGGRTLAV